MSRNEECLERKLSAYRRNVLISFAKQAVNGLCAQGHPNATASGIAASAFQIAEACISELEQRMEKQPEI